MFNNSINMGEGYRRFFEFECAEEMTSELDDLMINRTVSSNIPNTKPNMPPAAFCTKEKKLLQCQIGNDSNQVVTNEP